MIAIANTIPALESKKGYRSAHFLLDEETYQRNIDKIGFVLVELDKFEKTEKQLETDEEKWLYLLKFIGEADAIPKALQTGEFKEACELLNLMTLDKMDRMEYENRTAAVEAMKSSEEIEKAIAEERGIEKGKAEAKRELAKNMLFELKLPVEQVAMITGLSLEEIKKL